VADVGVADTEVLAGKGKAKEVGMALPKIVLRGRKIILLSGYNDRVRANADHSSDASRAVVVDAEDKLSQAALRNPDAVAFGYIQGEWIAAA